MVTTLTTIDFEISPGDYNPSVNLVDDSESSLNNSTQVNKVNRFNFAEIFVHSSMIFAFQDVALNQLLITIPFFSDSYFFGHN